MSGRKPTEYEAAGMAWWNGMTEHQRATAMQLAKVDTAAAAWDWHELQQQEEREAAATRGVIGTPGKPAT